MIIEGTVIALGLWAYFRPGKKPLSPAVAAERKAIFEGAMNDLADPVRLRALADTFAGEGMKVEADFLRKRANLKELPDATQQARRAAFRKAMTSHDPDAVRAVAKAFRREGALGAARDLETYARGLKAAQQVPVPPPPPAPPPVEEPQKPETDVAEGPSA